MWLSINRCPLHQDYWSVSVDEETIGIRITPGKCCGQWKIVKRWKLSSEDWKRLSKEALQAAKAGE